MSKQGLETMWRERMESFGGGGVTVRAWCMEHGVPQHQFQYWRRRLRDLDSVKPSGDWLALEVTSPQDSGGMVVRIGEAAIEVRPGFDASLLRAVVHALGNTPC